MLSARSYGAIFNYSPSLLSSPQHMLKCRFSRRRHEGISIKSGQQCYIAGERHDATPNSFRAMNARYTRKEQLPALIKAAFISCRASGASQCFTHTFTGVGRFLHHTHFEHLYDMQPILTSGLNRLAYRRLVKPPGSKISLGDHHRHEVGESRIAVSSPN